MFKNLKFPLIYVVEALLWLPLLAAFYGSVAFLGSEPLTSPELQGISLPPSWEAAVPNHGKFLRGYLISSHPLAFALILAMMLGSALVLFRVHKAQMIQSEAAGSSGATAHKIAHGCVFAFLAALSYVLVTYVLVGVGAA